MSEYKNELGQPIGFAVPDWQGCERPPRTPMQGRFVRLEAASASAHAADLFEAFVTDTKNRIWTYLPYGPFDSADALAAWMREACEGDDPLFHAIIDLASGKAVGVASYLRIEPAPGVIEVGHINYSPLMQKTPMATEAMFLMMKRVFDELGYRRYEWKCDALNAGSCAAAQRLGFSYEGCFRQATMYKQRNRDTNWYAIIDKDWPAIRAAYETWLAPENFDAAGKQIERLRAGDAASPAR